MSTRYAVEYDNMNNDLCSYGCGQIAKYKFKNGNLCCNKLVNLCPHKKEEYKINKKGTYNHTFEEIETDELCDYGCGNIAKYKFKSGLLCCSETHNSCPAEKDKNRKSNLGRKPTAYTIQRGIEVNRERMLNGDAKKMNEVPRDPEKKRINDEKSRERMLNGLAKKMNEIDPIGRSKKIRKTNEESGKWTKTEDRSDLELYRSEVNHYTSISINKKFTKEELDTRGSKATDNHIDHIFSVQEGFNLGILPIIISCKGNLRILTCSENSGKSKRCDITLEELFKRFDEENKEGDQQ